MSTTLRAQRALLFATTMLAAPLLAHAAGAAAAADATPAASAGAEGAEAAATDVDEVVVTGVRGSQVHTIANSPVPIDIISNAQIIQTGRVGLKEIFSNAIPSFTLPAQNGGGVSASVPPYSVRGLTADYVLILVNGKRRHSTALIQNLATIGGGSTPVDLDLIPPSAIDHIEVLRDGAAAQYGSDAIAGVINIILKSGATGGDVSTTEGQDYKSTGKLAQAYLDYGHSLLGGSINFTVDVDHHEPAPANGPSSGLLYPLVNGAPDPREATGNTNYGSAYGRSTDDTTIDTSYNLTIPLPNNLEFYSFSTLSYRKIKDARGAYRPDDLSSLPQIYPNGFQAYRLIHSTDFQVAFGVKGKWAGWDWDLSSTFGRDYEWLGADNTLNASLGPSVTQTAFFMGTQEFDQWTNNLDVTREFNIGLAKPLEVSWGVEHRWERFVEGAGEPNSYINGGYVVPSDGTPFGDLYGGKLPSAGLQSFTGTTPDDASSHSRNNFAGYVDLSTNLTSAWYVGASGRFEHYDDSSGDTASGKFATRYEILPGLAIRAAVNNGFRAPSLAEQDFSTTQNTTAPINGVVSSVQVKFLPANSALAEALGAAPLKPETSLNYSAGVTWEPTHRLRATLDVYQIDINNRIVKSSVLSGPAVQTILQGLGFSNLYSAQYFTNAVDTRTYGIDAVLEYQQSLGPWGSVNWSAIYAENQTGITHIKDNPAVLDGLGPTFQFFGPLAQHQLTRSSPRDRINLSADWSVSRWHVHFGETRYGSYLEPLTNTLNASFTPKWITDLEVSVDIRSNIKFAVGANNLFNTYPDRQPQSIIVAASQDTVLETAPGYKANAATYGVPLSGASLYGGDSPFGLNGGFYYGRLTVKF
jgi:iron complex outermembrane receptor protein